MFLLGLFVAVFVVTQEVLDVHFEEVDDQQEQAEGNSEDQEEIVYELTFDALLPLSSISIEPFQAILLAEISFESDQIEYPVEVVPLGDSPYNKTLFRQIISPNAP